MDTRMASHTRSGDRLGWVLGLTSTAYFMVVLDSLVVVSALPHMQHDLHASVASLQWTVNSYGISFAAGIVTAAALGDRFGRRASSISGCCCSPLPRLSARWPRTSRTSSRPGPCRASERPPSCRSA